MSQLLSFEAVADRSQTGDLLLSHGTSLKSRLLEFGMRTTFSHVAMIVRDVPSDILKLYNCPGDGRGVYVFDAHEMVDGCRLLPLDLWASAMREYHGPKINLAYRQIVSKDPNEPFRSLCNNHGTCQIIRTAANQSFNRSSASMMKAYARRYKGQPMRESVYCSELVARLFRSMGLLPGDIVPKNFVTSDFADATKLQNQMPDTFYAAPLMYVR